MNISVCIQLKPERFLLCELLYLTSISLVSLLFLLLLCYVQTAFTDGEGAAESHLDHTRITPPLFNFISFRFVTSLNNSQTPRAFDYLCDLGSCMLPHAHSILVTLFLKQARVIHISCPLNFLFLLLGVIFTNKWLLSFCYAPGT